MKTVWITVGKEDGKFVTKGEFATATEALNLANKLNSQYPDRYYDYTHKQIDNKRILGESNIDMDEVLSLMKYKFGWGDLSGERVEEFENWSEEVSDQMSSEEFADLFHDYMVDQSQPNDNDINGDIIYSWK